MELHMLPGMDDSPLNETMSYTGQLNLKHYQNSFVIAFSTFNFLSGASKYSYRMPPYDSEWSIPSAQNLATYRNLPPGKYQLQVKACNVAGVWGEESTMEIVIAPPFWQTTWAYSIYSDIHWNRLLFQFPYHTKIQQITQSHRC